MMSGINNGGYVPLKGKLHIKEVDRTLLLPQKARELMDRLSNSSNQTSITININKDTQEKMRLAVERLVKSLDRVD
jgi:hypothetical protein